MAYSLQAVLAQINTLRNSLPMMFQRIRLQERLEMLPSTSAPVRFMAYRTIR
jgi:hypothetical protein